MSDYREKNDHAERRDDKVLALFFHAPSYRARAGLSADTSYADAYNHFCTYGKAKGFDPGIFFNGGYWEQERKKLRGLPDRLADIPAFADWLEHGLSRRIIPTPLFDAAFYAAISPDAWLSGQWLFFHFLETGSKRGRAPAARYALLARELRHADVPRAGLQSILFRLPPELRHHFWTPQDIALLRSFFRKDFYVSAAKLPADTGDDKAFAHFLSVGIDKGTRPTILFNEDFYKQELEYHLAKPTVAANASAEERIRGLLPPRRGRPATSSSQVPLLTPLGGTTSPLLHWFLVGRRHGIVPTPLFDAGRYRRDSPDLANWPDVFEHYYRYGLNEDRMAHEIFEPAWYRYSRGKPISGSPLISYALSGEQENAPPGQTVSVLPFGESASPGETTKLEKAALQYSRDCALIASDAFQESIERAAHIEPLITADAAQRMVLRAPYRHRSARRADIGHRVRASLPRFDYHTVVAVPYCRMSGATRVAAHAVQALLDIYPQERILLAITDRSEFQRLEWFPEEVEVFDMARFFSGGGDEAREIVFLDFIRGLRPMRVININSRTAWDSVCRYGRQMLDYTSFHSYLFTWDIDERGNKTGYPIEWLERGLDFHASILHDNEPLRRELVERYRMTETQQRRMHVLWSPADTEGKTNHAENFERRQREDEPLTCFWAGRFDRQKRFDIVVEIARKMPNLTIHAWGTSVLGDTRIDISSLPRNIRLMGEYRKIDEIPFEDFGFFLYTAEWDGLPSVLIEAGARGLPVIASAVGGIPDLLSPETGWPVTDALNPEAFVRTIAEMCAAPAEVTRRAEALREITLMKCNPEQYQTRLKTALEGETA